MLLEPLQCQEYKIMVQLTTPTGKPVGVVKTTNEYKKESLHSKICQYNDPLSTFTFYIVSSALKQISSTKKRSTSSPLISFKIMSPSWISISDPLFFSLILSVQTSACFFMRTTSFSHSFSVP